MGRMGILEWFVKVILEFLFGKAVDATEDVVDKQKSKKATEENADELGEALKGDSDKVIEDSSEDLLNGNRN